MERIRAAKASWYDNYVKEVYLGSKTHTTFSHGLASSEPGPQCY